MSEEKDIERLETTEEMKELMHEYSACIELRDKCIDSVFRTSRAIYYAKRAVKVNHKFWVLADDLYPEIKKSHGWNFNVKDEYIYRKIKQLT